ncbi:uncharacterized protein LOC143374912 [Andrena cerasifolii]|uniref:uncharacterized protein LOC143374912 n=1 Tax=Andrena cerasifolii TaxID=2819439 RepID=UPI00403823DF
MLTSIGCLRDVNLDMNPNTQENYHLLCRPAGNLCYLSLKLCEISDNGMKKIANELQYRDPPDNPKLMILNLSNNRVTKGGASHIANMLRTNRSLKSLILLGNWICDEGASYIIQQLKITTLTHEEIVDLRRRKFAELSLRDELMEGRESEGMEEDQLRRSSKSRSRQSLTRRSRKSHRDFSVISRDEGSVFQDRESVQKKDLILGAEKRHPFKNESFPINGSIITAGNLELQYLDLSCKYFQLVLNATQYQLGSSSSR